MSAWLDTASDVERLVTVCMRRWGNDALPAAVVINYADTPMVTNAPGSFCSLIR